METADTPRHRPPRQATHEAPSLRTPEPSPATKDPAASDSPERCFGWLRTGRENLAAMLEAIRAARQSVRLETYIFDGGPLGLSFRQALVEACERGVRVRVLVDAVGSMALPDSFWAPLRAAGGECRWFNPGRLRRLGPRNHRKTLVVDDMIAFIGGGNIAPEYDGDGVTQGWRDLGLRIAGAPVAELAVSFDKMMKEADFRHRFFLRLPRRRTAGAGVCGDWRLLLSGPGRGHRTLKRSLVADLARARSVCIASAYFLPTWRLRRAMRRVVRQGGSVRLILAGNSDVWLAQLAGYRLYRGLLRAGIEIHEYQPQMLHTKLVIADNIVYAGSANLDTRSLSINYELLMRIESAPLASEARVIFADDLRHCRRIEAAAWRKSRGAWRKFLEGLAYYILARIDPHFARRQWRNLRGRS